MLSKINSFIFPQICTRCRQAAGTLQWCETCILELPWLSQSWINSEDETHPYLFDPPNIIGVISPLEYATPVSNAIHAFKYHGNTTWVKTLAMCMHLCWPESIKTPDIWIPIPLHASRYRERGFNQSFLIAKALAKLRGGKVIPQLLDRGQAAQSSAQDGLSREARKTALNNSFHAHKTTSRYTTQTLCLVDDVLTTGATLNNAATALKTMGAENILAITIARAL